MPVDTGIQKNSHYVLSLVLAVMVGIGVTLSFGPSIAEFMVTRFTSSEDIR